MVKACEKNLLAKADSFTAVSYTHLDVYKRQAYLEKTLAFQSRRSCETGGHYFWRSSSCNRSYSLSLIHISGHGLNDSVFLKFIAVECVLVFILW